MKPDPCLCQPEKFPSGNRQPETQRFGALRSSGHRRVEPWPGKQGVDFAGLEIGRAKGAPGRRLHPSPPGRAPSVFSQHLAWVHTVPVLATRCRPPWSLQSRKSPLGAQGHLLTRAQALCLKGLQCLPLRPACRGEWGEGCVQPCSRGGCLAGGGTVG